MVYILRAFLEFVRSSYLEVLTSKNINPSLILFKTGKTYWVDFKQVLNTSDYDQNYFPSIMLIFLKKRLNQENSSLINIC